MGRQVRQGRSLRDQVLEPPWEEVIRWGSTQTQMWEHTSSAQGVERKGGETLR